jgi:hypothetical protein
MGKSEHSFREKGTHPSWEAFTGLAHLYTQRPHLTRVWASLDLDVQVAEPWLVPCGVPSVAKETGHQVTCDLGTDSRILWVQRLWECLGQGWSERASWRR